MGSRTHAPARATDTRARTHASVGEERPSARDLRREGRGGSLLDRVAAGDDESGAPAWPAAAPSARCLSNASPARSDNATRCAFSASSTRAASASDHGGAPSSTPRGRGPLWMPTHVRALHDAPFHQRHSPRSLSSEYQPGTCFTVSLRPTARAETTREARAWCEEAGGDTGAPSRRGERARNQPLP